MSRLARRDVRQGEQFAQLADDGLLMGGDMGGRGRDRARLDPPSQGRTMKDIGQASVHFIRARIPATQYGKGAPT